MTPFFNTLDKDETKIVFLLKHSLLKYQRDRSTFVSKQKQEMLET
jgi:hypothetical protein